jgi:radical SAM protein with 4Fe4S-binding SPASM domain
MDTHPTVLWELTHACELHCRGCPSGAGAPALNELSTYEAYKTIDQIAELQPRELLITGGDPLERDDLHQIVDYARRRGLDPALVLNPTSHLTLDVLGSLQRHGLTQVVFSLDGSSATIHESIHCVPDSFGITLRAVRWAKRARLRIEVNTLVCRRNAQDLPAIARLLRPFSIARWNIHFLVPAGASKQLEMMTAAEVEAAFAAIEAIRAGETFAVRVVEAPHYRRFRLHRTLAAKLRDLDVDAGETPEQLHACAREGAHGFVYISSSGDVRPSEFVPQSAGNLRYRSLGAIYRGSDLFVALRDPENLKGKCHHCDFRHLCGGSRARAWAMTGDLFGTDPLCAYEPPDHGAAPATRGAKEATA